MSNIVRYNEEIVITTKMLAEAYECKDNNIIQNFYDSKDRFIEGKHYYKLEGQELKEFKRFIRNTNEHLYEEIKFNPVMILWTKRGASRHSKMLGTDKAWDMFDTLEESYFNPKVPQLTRQQELQLRILNGTELERVSALKEYEQLVTAPLVEEIGIMRPRIDYLDKIQGYGNAITTSTIATDYGMSARSFNKLLHELEIQYKQGSIWYLYQEHKGNGYEAITYYQDRPTMKWTLKGAEFLYHKLKEKGYVPILEQAQ